MPESSPSPGRDEFVEWVHDALNCLYDSPYLQTHPLVDLLADGRHDTVSHSSQNLRRVLLEAIRAMRPSPGVPARSPDWRTYRILELRYIEGLSPNEVMNQLALGKSQFYRDQARALQALADALWNRWQKARREVASVVDTNSATRENLIDSETSRLIANATWEPVDVGELLDDLQTIVKPLARAKDASVHFAPRCHPITLNADRVMLRQAILNIVTYALDFARRGHLDVSDFAEGDGTGIRITARKAIANAHPTSSPQRLGRGIDICRQLMTAMGGTFHLETGNEDHWKASLAWPTSLLRTLLVVDDNEGFPDLFRRYLTGYNWQIIGVTNGTEARQIISETPPTVIALDVMMPGEDGWEFLTALKGNKDLQNLPIIVCSVLNEPQLALELGAVAYLPKPVTQQALLEALAPWTRASANLGPAR